MEFVSQNFKQRTQKMACSSFMISGKTQIADSNGYRLESNGESLTHVFATLACIIESDSSFDV